MSNNRFYDTGKRINNSFYDVGKMSNIVTFDGADCAVVSPVLLVMVVIGCVDNDRSSGVFPALSDIMSNRLVLADKNNFGVLFCIL